MTKGFVKRRRDMDYGLLTIFERGVLDYVVLHAHILTGVWHGCAATIKKNNPAEPTSIKTIRRALRRLQELRFIKTFRLPGQRGKRPSLLHGYQIGAGDHKGLTLDALASTEDCFVYLPDDEITQGPLIRETVETAPSLTPEDSALLRLFAHDPYGTHPLDRSDRLYFQQRMYEEESKRREIVRDTSDLYIRSLLCVKNLPGSQTTHRDTSGATSGAMSLAQETN